MTTIVGFYLNRIPEALSEELADMFGPPAPFDPPRYRHNGLILERTPVPGYVKRFLPSGLRGAQVCLSLSERLVVEWSQHKLDPVTVEALREVLRILTSERGGWAVVVESATGEGDRSLVCEPSEVFDKLTQELVGETSSLVVVHD